MLHDAVRWLEQRLSEGRGGPKRRLERRAVLPIVGCGGEAFVVEFMGKEAMRMDAKAAGELIAARRKALGMNQAELAGRLHVTDKAVSKWETGRGMPDTPCISSDRESLLDENLEPLGPDAIQ